MHYYIYDSFLKAKKYQRMMGRIEARLTELGMKGKVARISLLRNIRDAVREAARSDATTIIAVGNDETLSEVLNALPDFSTVLGFIPIPPDSFFGDLLGIPPQEFACDILANRIIHQLDVGQVGERYFLSGVELQKQPDELECDHSFRVHPLRNYQNVFVYNLAPAALGPRGTVSPCDGRLAAVVTDQPPFWRQLFGLEPKNSSIISARHVSIKNTNPIPMRVDHGITLRGPTSITLTAKKIKMIVGKERQF